MKRRARSVGHRPALLRRLKEPDYAAKYLTACLEDGEDTFLLALRHVAEAHGGLRRLARRTELNREHLFRLLSSAGNPRFHSLRRITGELGFKWSLSPGRA